MKRKLIMLMETEIMATAACISVMVMSQCMTYRERNPNVMVNIFFSNKCNLSYCRCGVYVHSVHLIIMVMNTPTRSMIGYYGKLTLRDLMEGKQIQI